MAVSRGRMVLAVGVPFAVQVVLLVLLDRWVSLGLPTLGMTPRSYATLLLSASTIAGLIFLPRSSKSWIVAHVVYVIVVPTILFFFSFAFGAVVFGGP